MKHLLRPNTKAIVLSSVATCGLLKSEYHVVKHITAVKDIFPTIFAEQPETFVFNYDDVGNTIVKALFRIRSNEFYRKLQIHCYKRSVEKDTDSYLKLLGVDKIIYLKSREAGNAE
jgi:hypothetical protein